MAKGYGWRLLPQDAFFQNSNGNFMRLAAIIFVAILQRLAKSSHEDCSELRVTGISGPYRPCGWMDDFIAFQCELVSHCLHLRHETPV